MTGSVGGTRRLLSARASLASVMRGWSGCLMVKFWSMVRAWILFSLVSQSAYSRVRFVCVCGLLMFFCSFLNPFVSAAAR